MCKWSVTQWLKASLFGTGQSMQVGRADHYAQPPHGKKLQTLHFFYPVKRTQPNQNRTQGLCYRGYGVKNTFIKMTPKFWICMYLIVHNGTKIGYFGTNHSSFAELSLSLTPQIQS